MTALKLRLLTIALEGLALKNPTVYQTHKKISNVKALPAKIQRNAIDLREACKVSVLGEYVLIIASVVIQRIL